MNSWKRAHSQTAECNHKPLGGHRNDYNHFNMNVIEQFLELEFKYLKKKRKKKKKKKEKERKNKWSPSLQHQGSCQDDTAMPASYTPS